TSTEPISTLTEQTATTTEQTATTTEQTATTTEQSASTGMLPITINGTTYGNMIFVQGGTFQMGASDSDVYDDEQPVHSVTVSDFYIGETEVTQGLWRAVMGGNPSYFTRGDNYPVESVSWNDCQEFIYKLNQKTGKTFCLPTEAECEYAARGGNQSNGYKYSGSNNIDNVAVYNENSYNLGSNSAAYGTHAVKTMSSNELGLYDMSGNVWEWCSDWYGSYSSSSQTNPRGASSGSERVLRGGGWGDTARDCRVSGRYSSEPDKSYSGYGLRLVLVP
ncbi:MAG: formylglycine-generating enzyme family protein, partial [Bacteroidales bacterium]|nr:formylglycine-generating enzyme family protein [Bacteroidales bacterium]